MQLKLSPYEFIWQGQRFFHTCIRKQHGLTSEVWFFPGPFLALLVWIPFPRQTSGGVWGCVCVCVCTCMADQPPQRLLSAWLGTGVNPK